MTLPIATAGKRSPAPVPEGDALLREIDRLRRELDAVAQSWVDAALRLTERDQRLMGWLMRAQQDRAVSRDAGEAAEAAPVAVSA